MTSPTVAASTANKLAVLTGSLSNIECFTIGKEGFLHCVLIPATILTFALCSFASFRFCQICLRAVKDSATAGNDSVPSKITASSYGTDSSFETESHSEVSAETTPPSLTTIQDATGKREERFINLFSEATKKKKKTLSSQKMRRLASYSLPNSHYLTIVDDSDADFSSSTAAVVQASNEVIVNGVVRIPTGEARLIPISNRSLGLSMVIRAVGPDYTNLNEEQMIQSNFLLRNTYSTALDLAASDESIRLISFPLISAGAFLGNQDLAVVLRCGITSILDWSHGNKGGPKDIVMRATSLVEAQKLITTTDEALNLRGIIKATLLE